MADKGYDPQFCARPLKRVVQNDLVDGLAMKLIEAEVAEPSLAEVDVVESGLQVRLT